MTILTPEQVAKLRRDGNTKHIDQCPQRVDGPCACDVLLCESHEALRAERNKLAEERDRLKEWSDGFQAKATELRVERDALKAQLERIETAVLPLDRRVSQDYWTHENIATLAEAHREDSATVDGSIVPEKSDSYGTTYDYDKATAERQDTVNALRRELEALKARGDRP